MEQEREGLRFSPFLLPVLILIALAFFLGEKLLKTPPGGMAYRFDPRRVSLEEQGPDWLQPPMARAFFRAYLQASPAGFPLLDDEAYQGWLKRLRALPWVAQVSARRLVPNRVRLKLDLRRPLGVVFQRAGGWVFVTREGRLLPGDQDLLVPGSNPTQGRGRGARTPRAAFTPPLPGRTWRAPVRIRDLPVFYPLGVQAQAPGDFARDPNGSASLRSMGRLAEELRRHFLPRARRIAAAFQVPGGLPPLLGLSAGAPPPVEGEGAFETSDFFLLMRSRDGRVVWLAYGHAPGSPLAMIPWEEKALVLGKILRDHPGLHGLLQGDLRFRRYWKKHLKVPSPSSR